MLSIININPKKLLKNKWNSNEVSEENQLKLDNSLKEFGLFKPVLCRNVDGELEILGGAHRVDSAIRLGYSEIPVVNLGSMSDDKAKKIGLVDNGRYGSDDISKLQQLIYSLEDNNQLLDYLPELDIDIDNLITREEISFEEIPSFDESVNDFNEIERTKANIDDSVIMKFKIPMAAVQDLNKKIKETQNEFGIEHGDKMKNDGYAILQLTLGDTYEY